MARQVLNGKLASILVPDSVWIVAVLAVILASGFGARLYDLKDPPLDYASTRQLRSALIARSKYYSLAQDVPEWKREIALKQGNFSLIEPMVMETIVAGTYWLVGGEYVWIARIYASLFWVVGGVALYDLIRGMVGVDAAIVGLIYYLFAPFGVIASRSFQPDPLMTASIVFAWWTFYRWHRSHTWKWAILSGVCAGLAMYVKSTSIFFLLGGMGILALLRGRVGDTIRDVQVWAIALLSGLPVLIYHLYGLFIVGTLGQQFQGRFFPQLLLEPQFYRQLFNAMGTVIGHELLFFPIIIGFFLLRKKGQAGYVGGIWAGYILYILAFSYHSTTHYYYHLPAIPLAAITIGSFSDFVIRRLESPFMNNLTRIGLATIVLLGVGGTYYRLHEEDYRHEPGWYWKVTSKVDRKEKIAVLSQDYGNRIAYYGWITPKVWNPPQGQVAELRGSEGDIFEREFNQFVENMDYFIVTWMNALERQKKLHDKLYQTYRIHEQGGGYVIFDLNSKVMDE